MKEALWRLTGPTMQFFHAVQTTNPSFETINVGYLIYNEILYGINTVAYTNQDSVPTGLVGSRRLSSQNV